MEKFKTVEQMLKEHGITKEDQALSYILTVEEIIALMQEYAGQFLPPQIQIEHSFLITENHDAQGL